MRTTMMAEMQRKAEPEVNVAPPPSLHTKIPN